MYLTELPFINKKILLQDEDRIVEWVGGKRREKYKVTYVDGCYAAYEVAYLIISPSKFPTQHVVKRTMYNPDGTIAFIDEWEDEFVGYIRPLRC